MNAKLERFLLKVARAVIDRADEAVHGWEIHIRAKAAEVDLSTVAWAEVDPVASAAREKQIRKARRARAPRLRYVHGEFVRGEASR